ncbi:Peptidase C14 caspase domain-containing protein [Candidatus Electrothrix gigas]
MAERTEKRYAILIGSSKYPNEPGLTELRCPEKDVDALNAVLRSSDFGGFTETFVFKNRASHEILEKIETVLADAGREDLVLIYFSGHGKLNPAGQLCLATVNTKIKALGSTSIPVSWIKSYFDHSASQKKILLLDCCYSGAVGKDFIRGGVDDQLQLMSQGQGTFIMTASTGIEVAVEKEGDNNGLFTKHLVDGDSVRRGG